MWTSRVCALGVLMTLALPARDWLLRTYELPAAHVATAAQDTTGFLWVAAGPHGLFRFDGARFVRWAADIVHRAERVTTGPSGEVFVLPERGAPLYRITATGAAQEMEGVTGITADVRGRIWIAREDGLYILESADSHWRKETDHFWTGHYLVLYTAQKGSIFVTTEAGIWRAQAGVHASKIWNSKHMVNPLETSDGFLYVSEEGRGVSTLYRARGGEKTKLLTWRGRYCALLERAGSVWIFADGVTAVVRPGLHLDVLRPDERTRLGAGILVDREGSLWTSRPAGLSVVPEPDTEIWDEADGLSSPGALHMLERTDGLWVSNWTTLFRMRSEGGLWRLQVMPVVHYGELCQDRQGTLWTQRPWREAHFEKLRIESWVCASSADGAVWLAGDGLFRTPPEFGAPRPVRVPNGFRDIAGILEDRRGTLWITSRDQICSRPAVAATRDAGPEWTCAVIPGAKEISALIELSSGSIWAGTKSAGIWRFDGRSWSPIPAGQGLFEGPSRSRRGGAWVFDGSERMRVVEDRDSSDGWRVVDRVNAWQGVPNGETVSALETNDGSLWLAMNLGLVRVPPHVSAPKPAPPIVLTSLWVNGKLRTGDRPLRIPPGENQLEVDFAALSYRDPTLLRYQYRLNPDVPWRDANEIQPRFRFLDLRPGEYRLEVRASLDGVAWSTAPAALPFQVLAPWYLRWWALLFFAALVSTALYAAYRVRRAVGLRLERQRASIAMDLHDEIGSGLGSIGILSELAASDQVNEQQRRDFASRIAQTSGDLGMALSDIVWSLRPDSNTVEALAAQLARRGNALFPNSRPEFRVEFPECRPLTRLLPFERRNLLLIGQEALHNAARHANAGVVLLVFEYRGGQWAMRIIDDGCGVEIEHLSGMGLSNMRERAKAMGAEIHFERARGGGTVIEVRFKAGTFTEMER